MEKSERKYILSLLTVFQFSGFSMNFQIDVLINDSGQTLCGGRSLLMCTRPPSGLDGVEPRNSLYNQAGVASHDTEHERELWDCLASVGCPWCQDTLPVTVLFR